MSKKGQWKEDLKSPWLRGIIGTIFVALIVNVTIIILSYYYPHSLVAKDYYNNGKEYFHAQAEESGNARLSGYQLRLTVPEKPGVDDESPVSLQVIDHNGKIIKDGTAILFVYRVNDHTKDFQQVLRPSSNGQFSSGVKFSLPGTWDLIAEITTAGQKRDVAKRIFVGK